MAGADPRATLAEIEAALDGLLGQARAQLLQDVALASEARNIDRGREDDCFRCPRCGSGLRSRGEAVRRLCASQDQPIELRRSRGVCPACGTGIFPPG